MQDTEVLLAEVENPPLNQNVLLSEQLSKFKSIRIEAYYAASPQWVALGTLSVQTVKECLSPKYTTFYTSAQIYINFSYVDDNNLKTVGGTGVNILRIWGCR